MSVCLEALIFDVDGTLADTEEAHRQAFNAAFRERGLDWYWSQQRYLALLEVTGGKERIRHYLDMLGWRNAQRDVVADAIPAIHATKTHLYATALATGAIRLRDGVATVLRAARQRGIRLAIATTTSPANVVALLNCTLGADAEAWFDVIAAGDVVQHKKPAPDIYRLALAELGTRPACCVAIEDSANGLEAARAAGIRTAVMPCQWTEHQDFSAADLIVRRPVAHASRGSGDSDDSHVPHCATLDLGRLEALVTRSKPLGEKT